MACEPRAGDTCKRCAKTIRYRAVRNKGDLGSNFTPEERQLGCDCFAGPLVDDE